MKWYKNNPDDKIWWLDDPMTIGKLVFSFDKKTENKSDSVFAIKVGYSAFAPLPESFYDDTDAFGEALQHVHEVHVAAHVELVRAVQTHVYGP